MNNNEMVKKFTWKDGEFSCGTGELLCALTKLTETNKDDAFIKYTEIADYLVDKGLVEQTENSRYRVKSGQEDAIVTLGSDVSDAIDEEMNALVATDARVVTAK